MRKTLFDRVDEAVAGVCIAMLGISGGIFIGIVIVTIILLIRAYIKNN